MVFHLAHSLQLNECPSVNTKNENNHLGIPSSTRPGLLLQMPCLQTNFSRRIPGSMNQSKGNQASKSLLHKHIMLNTISTSVTASNPHWVLPTNHYVYCQNIKINALCFPSKANKMKTSNLESAIRAESGESVLSLSPSHDKCICV